ncbi:MAG TPA: hypothetical protein VFM88_07430 [Vicinamibacteria bacterium]|nr:hypothetical protein [Vicinamibacteria bacterium]
MRSALAVALVSSSLLAAEIVLARLFALWFRVSYAYLVVSGAACGLALGCFLAQGAAIRAEALAKRIEAAAVALSAALALPVLLLVLAAGTGLDLLGALPLVLLLTLLVFSVGGALLAALFRANVGAAGGLYAADLGAAALGAPLAILLLDRLGAVRALLALSAGSAAFGLVGARRSGRLSALAASLLLPAVAMAGLGGRWSDSLALTVRPPRSNPFHPAGQRPKELFVALSQGSTLVRSDWDAVARSDVVMDRGPAGPAYRIFMDGAVPTPMEAWDGSPEDVRRTYGAFIGMLPYRVASDAPARVFALGAGGGLDVLLALAAGASEVDAVDVNPALPGIVADPRFRETSARAYRDPRVRLRIEEGRSFLSRAGAYDVIYAACALTNTLQAGAGVVESHLYTVEAFEEYWRHLTPDGILAVVVEDGKLADRLFLTALEALGRAGIPDAAAAGHLLTAHATESRSRVPYRHILMVRRSAWQPGEARALVATVSAMRLEPRHVPHVASFGARGGSFDARAPARTIAERLAAEYPAPTPPELRPVTDDRPFFVDFARQLDPAQSRLLAGVLALTALALLAFLLLGRGAPAPAPAAATLLFAGLGIGFMAVETVLIQKLGLLLGFPTRALAVGLGALLAGASLGSFLSRRWEGPALARRAHLSCAAVLVCLSLFRLALPSLSGLLAPHSLSVRAVAAVMLLGMLGLPMGVPFSAALRLLSEPLQRLIPALWGVNGIASLLGAVGTVALAKFWGYQAGLLLAMAAYAVAWLALAALAGYPLRDTRHTAQ